MRTVPRDGRHYGPEAHTLLNGYTLLTAAKDGSQASVANEAIARNAQPGVPFTVKDVYQWQKTIAGEGRSLNTLTAHLESLVGKGFLLGNVDEEENHYQVVPEALGKPE